MTSLTSFGDLNLLQRLRGKSASSGRDGRVTKDQLLTYLKTHLKRTSSRERLINVAERQYCGNMLKFLAAIFDYEHEAGLDATTTFMNRFEANRLVQAFVATDATFEVSLSAPLRIALVEKCRNFADADVNFFDAAKNEIAHDIMFNPQLLKALYE